MTETATIETERTEEMTQGGESAQRQAEQMVDAWTINQIDTVLARITEGFGAWLGPKYKAGGRRELTDAWANPGQSAQDYLKVIIGKIRTQLQLTADCMQCSSHSIPENHRAIVNPDFCNPQIDLFVGAVLQNAGARKEFKKIVKARKEDLK